MRHPFLLLSFRFCLLLLLAPGLRAQGPVLVRGPYLQSASPSALTVCWRTSLAGTGRVRCGTAGDKLNLVFEEAVPGTDHAVRLTGLTPATHYFYAVELDAAVLATGEGFHFYTPPVVGSVAPVRFWVLGDAGTQGIYQQRVRDAFAPVHAQRRADFWLMLGDNAYYSGTDQQYQAAVFDMYPDYLKTLPLWSCIGNHETYGGADENGKFAWDNIFSFPTAGECGGVPSGTERYYSWNYGQIHFIALDSMTASRASDGPMAQWLTADLEANLQPWVIAFWHHPPYTKGSHNSDFEGDLVQIRGSLLPILESHGVDLVLCGHSHAYERSFLINGHYGLSGTFNSSHIKGAGSGREDVGGPYYKAGAGMAPNQGAVYVVAGSSGQVGGGALDHPAHFIGLRQLGSVVVDVNGTRMDVKFLRDAEVPGAAPVFGDWFSIVKGVEPPPVPALSRGPYLQKAAPSAMTVCWRTSLPSGGRVRYGTVANALTAFADEQAGVRTDHTVRLTGLAPGTRYYYRVESAGLTLAGGPGYFFTTPPATGSAGPHRVWVLGDAGTNSAAQRAVRDAFISHHNSRPAGMWLMLGDNAYGVGNDSEYEGAVFDMYHPWLEQVPLWSCIGNHETYGDEVAGKFAWDKIFDFPAAGECGGVASGTERYYSWDYGNIHFIALDSMTSSRAADGPMAQWLTADLEANLLPWTVVCFHHPPYTKGTHDSDWEEELIEMRENILPILEEHSVDLVLCGHSHVYERSFLLDGHYGSSDTFTGVHKVNGGDGRADGSGVYVKPAAGPVPHSGTVYVVAGCSGQAGGGELNHPAHFRSLDVLGSLILDVTGDRMDVRFLREVTSPHNAAAIDDYFTILKSSLSAPAAPGGLRLLPLTATSAQLYWNDHAVTEECYRVRLAPDGGPFSWLASNLPPNSTDHTLTGLMPEAGYAVAVAAHNLVGSSFSAPLQFQLPADPPPVTPIEKWRFGHWGSISPDGDHADDADADADGSSNLLEYALGSSPAQALSVPLLQPGLTPDGRLTLTFLRQPATDLTYTVEFSSNLEPASWDPVWSSSGNSNSPGYVAVPDSAPIPGARRFVRLKVTLVQP